jgi:hypothetical protein
MPKDVPDATTIPPPAGGDIYAAETMVGTAPLEIIEELKAPEQVETLSDEDVETLMLAPEAELPSPSANAELLASSDVSPNGGEIEANEASDFFHAPSRKRWALAVAITALICALMFLLGRLL